MRCSYCDDQHFTDTTYNSSRHVETPNGEDVHFRCLREWLIDDALNRWTGRQSRNGRAALRKRFRLEQLPAEDMPTVNDVAAEMGYSFPWVSQVQREAMEVFERRATATREERSRKATASQEKREQQRERNRLIQALKEDVDALADHLDVDGATFEFASAPVRKAES